MAKSNNSINDLQEIIDILSNQTDGYSIEDISSRLKLQYERRTLQRRLKELIVTGEVLSLGKGRATKTYLFGLTNDQQNNTPLNANQLVNQIHSGLNIEMK